MSTAVYRPERARDPRAAAVLRFWFGEPDAYGRPRPEWFRKDAHFDDAIRERFLDLQVEAAQAAMGAWQAHPLDCLALIVVLDQFPRNLFRGDARAFASDALARAAAEHALACRYDQEMLPVERQFVYLPFEHSEALDDQRRCLELMSALEAYPETRGLSEWARKHLEVIERYGRFPHRNAALGRENTPDEREYLARPGAGF